MGAVLPLQHRAARAQCHANGDEIVQGVSKQGITPSQTVGPFFKYGLTPDGQYDWNDAFTNNLVTPDVSGDRIRIEGRVFDGAAQRFPDCRLKIWRPDGEGRSAARRDGGALRIGAFGGFGRCGTDPNGGTP